MKSNGPPAPVRFAVRQVLDQEYQTEILRQRAAARQARYHGIGNEDLDARLSANSQKEIMRAGKKPIEIGPATTVKRDFFGRIINEVRLTSKEGDGENGNHAGEGEASAEEDEKKVWVSFHEGYSNAVRKPITMKELLGSL